MYNRYVPNPDGTYQRQRVFDQNLEVEAKFEKQVPIQLPDMPAPPRGDSEPKPPGGMPGSMPDPVGKPAPRPQSEGPLSKLNLSTDDLLVLAVLLLLLLEDEDEQLVIVLAVMAFFLL